jgi:hypothetical protein
MVNPRKTVNKPMPWKAILVILSGSLVWIARPIRLPSTTVPTFMSVPSTVIYKLVCAISQTKIGVIFTVIQKAQLYNCILTR